METSSVLLEANVSYTDKNTCRDMYSNGFQSLVTIDKFCADSQLGNIGLKRILTFYINAKYIIYLLKS